VFFFRKSSPILAFISAAASSHMFSSRSIAINCSGGNKVRKYSNLKRWLFTLKNLAVDTGYLTLKIIFDAESKYDIHILIVSICQFLRGAGMYPHTSILSSYEGVGHIDTSISRRKRMAYHRQI
jgi:hypothetical protein